jgi:hypothetical protein
MRNFSSTGTAPQPLAFGRIRAAFNTAGTPPYPAAGFFRDAVLAALLFRTTGAGPGISVTVPPAATIFSRACALKWWAETFNDLARTLGTRDSQEVATQRGLLMDQLGTARNRMVQAENDLERLESEIAVYDLRKGEAAEFAGDGEAGAGEGDGADDAFASPRFERAARPFKLGALVRPAESSFTGRARLPSIFLALDASVLSSSIVPDTLRKVTSSTV